MQQDPDSRATSSAHGDRLGLYAVGRAHRILASTCARFSIQHDELRLTEDVQVLCAC
jgi:hypothetical protein